MNRWLQASRPLAHANIGFPLLYGQAAAAAVLGVFDLTLLLLVHVFGVLCQLFIVFGNDAADWQTDVQNRTYNRFSGGSRVVPEGKLTPRALAIASMVALALMAAVSVYLVFHEMRPLMLAVCALVPGLLWAYSFDPLRLSYRGHGELLQGFGVGIVLPFIGFYVQSGSLLVVPWAAFIPTFLVGYAGNVTTALPDTPSDRASGKRTFPVRLGELTARRVSMLLIGLALLIWPFTFPEVPRAAAAVVTAVALFFLVLNLKQLPTADATERSSCERFVALNGAAITVALGGWSAALFFLG